MPSVETLSFSDVANLGSLVGLLATLWAAWKAYQSKQYYLLVGRVPDGVKALRENTSKLAVANSSPAPERKEILLALKGMRVALESIVRNIGRRNREEFSELKRRIKQIEQQSSLNPEELDEIYAEGEALAAKATEIVRDRKFSRS